MYESTDAKIILKKRSQFFEKRSLILASDCKYLSVLTIRVMSWRTLGRQLNSIQSDGKETTLLNYGKRLSGFIDISNLTLGGIEIGRTGSLEILQQIRTKKWLQYFPRRCNISNTVAIFSMLKKLPGFCKLHF